ncbi:MAG: SDR family NAD(P)-dependent oxidoreductase, partial [Alphaproteobacteria bacterium]|nr:SDR family NAD(P)-dependent oxidoreductase [Alphaproteobacteria bacterium]
MRFQNQVAVITAAGAGIGKATAEIMVQEGATVIAIDVDNARLEALKEAMVGAGAPGKVIPKMLDAADQT